MFLYKRVKNNSLLHLKVDRGYIGVGASIGSVVTPTERQTWSAAWGDDTRCVQHYYYMTRGGSEV
jgi:peptidase E